MTGYDFIIVGGGTAGCVMANRLSKDPATRVLVIHAGSSSRNVLLRMPVAFPILRRFPKLNTHYVTEPEPFAAKRALARRQGRVFGGSSSINGMLYHRGHSADYDEWRALGLNGWTYADVLPYFLRAENSWRGANEYHGASGPICISTAPDTLLGDALRRAFESLRMPLSGDLHGAQQTGLSAAEFMVGDGRRADTASRYLQSAKSRGNLTVFSNATALRILLEKDRAVGVEFERAGQVLRAAASSEVILCAGAYNSPQLLMLSGIGAADELSRIGLSPTIDLPGVGRNLQTHCNVVTDFAAKAPIGFHDELRLDRAAVSALRWLLFQSGSMASVPISCTALLKTDASHDRPDILAGYAGCAMDDTVWIPRLRPGRGRTISVVNALLHPRSRGRVTLRSTNIKDAPRVSLNLLAEPEDRAALIRSIEIQREIFGTQPMAAWISKELSPGPAVRTPAALDAYLRSHAGASQHPTSTCAMGTGPEAVVDEQLRVRGLRGLRVVDASVMPLIVGGGTCAPTIMIAEKAAEMLLQGGASAQGSIVRSDERSHSLTGTHGI